VVSHVQGLEVKGQSSPFGPAASTSTHCSTHLLHNGQIALLTINNAPVNSLNDSVFSDIRTHFDAAEKDPAVKAIVFTGAGRTFSCGADLNMIAGFQQEFLEGKVQDGANVRNMLLRNHELLNRIENGAKPTVAMVNGPALGGGCELAMSCNQRVCFKAASFSLPELSLGLIPGLGGCVRLPRLIGLDKAVTHTVSGKSINAKNALKWGLVMSVAKKPAQLFEQAVKVALGMAAGKVPRNMALLNDAKIGTAAQTELVIDTAKQSKAMRRSKNPSVIATYLEVARLGALYGGNVGLQREIDSFIKAVNSPGAHGLVYAFLTSRACATIPGLNWKAAKKVKTVAVLGAGTMGGGIAIALLSSGYKVILTDINQVRVCVCEYCMRFLVCG
jgi:3-hydroxyacyl-CoA dehydrogenase